MTNVHPPSTVSMRVVASLVAHLDAVGVSPSVFLRAAKLQPHDLCNLDVRVPRRAFYEMCAVAIELTGDLAFGLHSVERMSNEGVSPLAEIVAHSATLRAALESINELRKLLGDDASYRIYEDEARVWVRLESLAEETLTVRRFVSEVALAGLLLALRRLRSDFRIGYAAFAYEAPPYYAEYIRVFDGRARFCQAFTGLCFDRKWMAASPSYRDPEVHRALQTVARRRIAEIDSHIPYAQRVHQTLVAQASIRDTSMKDVARGLGMSVRNLRRRLAAEGTGFAELVREAMATRAKTLLREERCTVKDAASQLGFASTTSFHRAFKRQTGLTPAAYRRVGVPQSEDTHALTPPRTPCEDRVGVSPTRPGALPHGRSVCS